MQTKICTKCKIEKKLKEFNKSSISKDGLKPQCKHCIKEYRDKNKEMIYKKKKIYHKKFPWKVTLCSIKQRCNNKNNKAYKYYGGRGIKCLITADELKILWFRDKAYLMDRPSIDREDSNRHYEYGDCEYIELSENSIKDKKVPVLQYNLDGSLVKEWDSATEAGIELNISNTKIYACCRKTAGGFIWKHKEGETNVEM